MDADGFDLELWQKRPVLLVWRTPNTKQLVFGATGFPFHLPKQQNGLFLPYPGPPHVSQQLFNVVQKACRALGPTLQYLRPFNFAEGPRQPLPMHRRGEINRWTAFKSLRKSKKQLNEL